MKPLTCSLEPAIEDSVSQDYSNSLMEVHLVDKGDIFYKKGRILAEKVYHQIWNTEKLVDNNDYAVVIAHNGSVIGNLNIQIGKEGSLLKSESFFCPRHWRAYYQGDSNTVAEISALALSQDMPTELRRPALMMMIVGIQNLCRLEGINLLATVQHQYLIRILESSLHLPMFRNDQIKFPQGKLPHDGYWQREKPPGIYYLKPLSFQAVDACYSFLSYLNLAGINTALLPRIRKEKVSYSAFRKSWHQDHALAALS